MSKPRKGTEFAPRQLQILGLNFSPFSRTIILEVLRGLGCRNENIQFAPFLDLLQEPDVYHVADLLLLSHESDSDPRLDLIPALRRLENPALAETPVILLSGLATRSLIQTARDVGVDEVVMRPISPLQLQQKIRQVIETPRNFVTSGKYVGPCRRRKANAYYSGARRRLSDFKESTDITFTAQEGADDLATAVVELREACAELSTERLGLVARVRLTAERTADLARQNGDTALERTAAAVKLYLDGIGSQNALETHVLETGINALTQLAILPKSYVGARESVAHLMTIAVRKKLLIHERRKQQENSPDALLDQINSGAPSDLDTVDLEQMPEPKRLKA